MSFVVAADAYGRFMGRYAEPLAAAFADYVEAAPGDRALDVGCGPGALTAQLVRRLDASAVSAIDPSPPFVEALRVRLPGVDVRLGVAGDLPFADSSFDLTTAQLVVHFMPDPVAGLAEMARVTRPGGTVAACVWDHGGGGGPLAAFWQAVHDIDPAAPGEADLPGTREGHLAQLCAAAGLREVSSRSLTIRVGFQTLEEWWEPYTLGVGPAGDYVAALSAPQRERLRDRCAELLPPAPFEISAVAWCVRAKA